MEFEKMFFKLDDENLDTAGAAAKVLEGHGGIFFDLFKGLQTDNPTLRSNCFQVLTIVAEKNPEKIFDEWDFSQELGDKGIGSLLLLYRETHNKSRILEFVKQQLQGTNPLNRSKDTEFLRACASV